MIRKAKEKELRDWGISALIYRARY